MPKLLLIERNIVLVDSLKNGSYFFVRDVRQTPDNEDESNHAMQHQNSDEILY